MTLMTRTWAPIAAAAAIAVGLSSCGGKKAEAPKPQQTELAELSVQLENWASRAEQMVQRPWSKLIEFPKRLHVRVQIIRSFGQEAAAAASDPNAATESLVTRGRTLMAQGRPFDAALTLLEREAPTIDQVTGYDRMMEMLMGPLETKGEAPFRERLTNLRQQAALGFKYLDSALAETLEQAPDAEVHQKIASKALRDALETSVKLGDEVKKSSALAGDVIAREKVMKDRVAWADSIVKKAGDAVPAEAAKTLKESREFVEGKLPERSKSVLEMLRNATPDAAAKANELSRDADAVLTALTTAFLEIGRKFGVKDPA
jgi:hypothetical protein